MFTNDCQFIQFLVKLDNNIGELYMKIYTRFFAHPECNLLNIYHIKTVLKKIR
jgi:hypothetical protein